MNKKESLKCEICGSKGSWLNSLGTFTEDGVSKIACMSCAIDAVLDEMKTPANNKGDKSCYPKTCIDLMRS